ncbi:MAG TPA: hypothetical protein VD970_12455, partial [Acetobacteraceae bacterium]|nr:hypothetical protein [Acetobacteraceae bacterium]
MQDGPRRNEDSSEQAPRAVPPAIRRRIVLHVPGFEPLTPAQHRGRFARTLAHAAATWRIEADCGDLTAPAGTPVFPARASGPDWRCESEIRLLVWDDLIRAEMDRPLPARLARGGAALGEVLATGTLARYAATHWR